MKITILTLFPEMFEGPFSQSIVKRAQESGSVHIRLVNIRDFGLGTHKVVDDKPYGGGIGMVLKVDVIDAALQSVKDHTLKKEEEKTILLDPRGNVFQQQTAKQLSLLSHLILVCGHYEGVDERVRNLVDATISIGDFILTGGEIPAMLITDAIVRLVSGVLKQDATTHESFTLTQANGQSLLEYPQYTTPGIYKGKKVPDILLSGHHSEIEKWRKEQAARLTTHHRPDLLAKATENS